MIVAAAADRVAFRQAVRTFRKVDGGDRFLDAEGTISFLAIEEGVVVGWCWGQHMIRPDEASMLYLHELDVAESFRRRGIGWALVTAFLDAGRTLGATKAFLVTGQANEPARSLYEELGATPAEQGPTVSYWFPLPDDRS